MYYGSLDIPEKYILTKQLCHVGIMRKISCNKKRHFTFIRMSSLDFRRSVLQQHNIVPTICAAFMKCHFPRFTSFIFLYCLLIVVCDCVFAAIDRPTSLLKLLKILK